jgi:nucleotide-binding universal stress UspA family protein
MRSDSKTSKRPAEDIAEEHWSVAGSKLELFLESEFPKAKSPRILVAGDAASKIAETAKKTNSDLIIMPTHAERFRQMLLGSTTAKVLDEANCPALTMRRAAIIVPRSLEHRNWICAAGLTTDSERVLRYAQDAARAVGAKLSLIHVIPASEVVPDAQSLSEEKRKALEHLSELQKSVGSDASVSVATGPVKETVLNAVRQSSADVLVIGRGPDSSAHGLMRDLAYAFLRDSPPVVSV